MTAAGLLEEHVGLDACVIELAGVEVATHLVTGYRVTQGRTDPTGAPTAGVCKVELRSDAVARLPRVGDPLTVRLGDDGLAWAGLVTVGEQNAGRWRFVGNVTDVTAAPGVPVTSPGLVTVTATTARARLGRTYVGDTPWPVEDDGARAARILDLAAAQAALTIGLHDAGTVTVLARDVDRQLALQLLDELGRDTGGALVELRDGSLVWQDANHRRGAAPVVDLTSANVLVDGAAATQSLAGLVNDLQLSYGPPIGGGDPASVRRTDTDSVTRFGPFAASVRTQLANEADADALAYVTVGRRSVPRWDQPSLTLELLRSVTAAQRKALLRIEVAQLLTVSGFPASGPFRRARLWVEGWTETVTRHAWSLQLVVSDYGRSGTSPRWVDVVSDLTWGDVDPEMTWWQAVGADFGSDDPGRWIDRPAAQRWDQLDPALTWADLA